MLIAAAQQASHLGGPSGLEAAGGAPSVAGRFQNRSLHSRRCALFEMLHKPEESGSEPILILAQFPSAEFVADLALWMVSLLSLDGFGDSGLQLLPVLPPALFVRRRGA